MLLDRLSEFFAQRPGLLPVAGVLLVVLNFVLQFVPLGPLGWLTDTALLLHLGVVTAILGILLIRPLAG